ncbi:ABC transporter permease [Nonomuraea sp. NBC_00507]
MDLVIAPRHERGADRRGRPAPRRRPRSAPRGARTRRPHREHRAARRHHGVVRVRLRRRDHHRLQRAGLHRLRGARRAAHVRRVRGRADGRERGRRHDRRHDRPLPYPADRRLGGPRGHVVASVVRNVAACGFALVAAIALGFRPDATLAGWALVLGLVAAYVLAMSSLAVLWGLLVKSTQAAGAFSFVVLFLPYLSDGVVPAETMPGVLRDFAYNQPITPIVATLRALLLGEPVGSFGVVAALWLAGVVAVSVPIAAVLFRRRTSA